MKIISKLKNIFRLEDQVEANIDEAEINIFGIKVKMTRKTNLPVPQEFSVFIPRLELTKKVTEGNKTTENSLILNSLTIVSAPRHEPSDPSTRNTKSLSN